MQLEVSGLAPNDNPIAAWADDDTDPDLIDQLYRTGKHRPLFGEGAERWD